MLNDEQIFDLVTDFQRRASQARTRLSDVPPTSTDHIAVIHREAETWDQAVALVKAALDGNHPVNH
jgi:hypothetical protein